MKSRTVYRNKYIEIEETVRSGIPRKWTVPEDVTYLVIPCNEQGRWIGPPVAVDGINSEDAALVAATRTLEGRVRGTWHKYGFQGGDVPGYVFVVPTDPMKMGLDHVAHRLRGEYLELSVTRRVAKES